MATSAQPLEQRTHPETFWSLLAALGTRFDAMPMKYQTLIGDMGASLSGGQKQRLFLARALYKRPRIFFLDEATSHLDVDREREVNSMISTLNLTGMIDAHRPETIRSADRIIEMSVGSVVRDATKTATGPRKTTSIPERAQARVLARLLSAEPGAKVFVYAGYAQIRKNAPAHGRRWMASYLREFSGVAPLKVDQVGGTPSPYDQVSDPVWLGVRHRLDSRSSVFKTATKVGTSDWLVSENYSGAVDVTVFHPQFKLVGGRPEWLAEGTTAHRVAAKLVGIQRPAAIRAVLIYEKDGVPVDQVLLTDHSLKAELYRPDGSYRIERETLRSGLQTLYEVTISGRTAAVDGVRSARHR